MEGISNYSRLRAVVVLALVASGLVLMAMSGSASADGRCGPPICKNISAGIVNDSNTAIHAFFCRRSAASASDPSRPCQWFQEDEFIGANGQRHTFPNTNPLGIEITRKDPPAGRHVLRLNLYA